VLDALADGTHLLELAATDEAGNVGPGLRVAWTQDTVAPNVTVLSAPPALSPGTRAAVAFLTDEPADVTCSLDGSLPAPCASPALMDALSAGPHVLLLAATDGAGNAGPPAEVRWSVDPTAPAAPVLMPLSSTVSMPPVEGSAEPGARVVITVDGQPLGEVDVDPTGHFTFPLPAPLGEGLHEVTAVAVDAAGNAGLPAHQPVLTDTVPPVVTITFGPSPLYNRPQATFRFVASETATFLCSVDGDPGVTCGSPWMTAALADGPHLLSVVAEDSVGNVGPAAQWRWTGDSLEPTVQLVRWPAPLERVDTATLEWTLSEPADTRCTLDGAPGGPCVSALTLAGLSEGDHRVTVRAVDATGNPGPEAEVRWRVDTLAPETLLVQRPPGLSGTSFALLSFTSEPGAAFDCSLDGEPFRACVVPAVFPSLADGAHRFEVRAVDEAGNPDGTPEVADWEVDAREPDTTIVTGPFEDELMGEDVAFSFSATVPDAAFECSLDAADFQPCAAEWTFQFLPTASHSLAVRAVSRAGVVDPSPALRTWLTDPDALATRKIRVNASNCGCTAVDAAWPWWGLLGLAVAVKRKRAETRNRITAP